MDSFQEKTPLRLNQALQKLDDQAEKNANASVDMNIYGENLEILTKYYFENDPYFKNEFKKIYAKDNFSQEILDALNRKTNQDIGIDLIAENKDGEYSAIQVKRGYNPKLNRKDVESFLVEIYKNKNIFKNAYLVHNSEKGVGPNLIKEIDQNDNFLIEKDLGFEEFDYSGFFDKQKSAPKTKRLRDYQQEALQKVVDGFQTEGRGQLIMATGTGKTLTSLKIIEKLTEQHEGEFRVLFVVPTLLLLGQTLEKFWEDKTIESFNSFAINSDSSSTRKTNKNKTKEQLGYPATTNPEQLVDQYKQVAGKNKLQIFFSTYQSLETVHNAQRIGLPNFDFIVVDEAHKTAGEGLSEDPKDFQQILPDDYIKAKKRLFQTATPKVFKENASDKANAHNLELFDMNDERVYGREFFHYSLGDAIKNGYLSDYEIVLSLIWDDDPRIKQWINLSVDPSLLEQQTQFNSEISQLEEEKNKLTDKGELEDKLVEIHETEQELAKIEKKIKINQQDIGRFINLAKVIDNKEQIIFDINNESEKQTSLEIKRILGFTDTNAHSKFQVRLFENIQEAYTDSVHPNDQNKIFLQTDSANGGMNNKQKKEKLDTLASPVDDNEVRFLNNVKFLTEGIDVPNIDSVTFLSPKSSSVDIIQAIGRSLRKDPTNENKVAKIIIPALLQRKAQQQLNIDGNLAADLDDQGYKTIREVISNLRLNDKREEALRIKVSSPSVYGGDEQDYAINMDPKLLEQIVNGIKTGVDAEAQLQEIQQFSAGLRRYVEYVRQSVSDYFDVLNVEQKQTKDEFYKELNDVVNLESTGLQFNELVTQHITLDPLLMEFFEIGEVNEYATNQVRMAFNKFLNDISLNIEPTKTILDMQQFIKEQVSGVTSQGKLQDILNRIYDVYFKTDPNDDDEQKSLRKTVYPTPSSIVDFMIESVDQLLEKEFGLNYASEDVGILEPFIGTGTFIVSILSYLKSRLGVSDDQLITKLNSQIFGQELQLIGYYIATSNIQSAINGLTKKEASFNNLYMGDTFKSLDLAGDRTTRLKLSYLDANERTLQRSVESPVKVILGNPPYIAQAMAPYKDLQKLSNERYKDAESSSLVNMKKTTILSNTYVGALTYSIERLSKTDKGIISYIFPHDWLTAPTAIGIRKYIQANFRDVYILDLKGSYYANNKEIQGENVFGIQQGVAIVLLVKDTSEKNTNKANIHYYPLDATSSQEKLDFLDANSLNLIEWETLEPDSKYNYFPSNNPNEAIYDDEYQLLNGVSYQTGTGLKAARDSWTINSNSVQLERSIWNQINYYNENVSEGKYKDGRIDSVRFKYQTSNKPEKINVSDVQKSLKITNYRPFVKKWIYAPNKELKESNQFIHRFGKITETFRDGDILLADSKKIVDMLALDGIGDNFYLTVGAGAGTQFINISQSEKKEKTNNKADGALILDLNLDLPSEMQSISKRALEENGALIYAITYTPQFRKEFSEFIQDYYKFPEIKNNAIKKQLTKIGEKLIDLHLNYDKPEAPKFDESNIYFSNKDKKELEEYYNIKKIVFDRTDKNKLIFNENITIQIPQEVFDFQINGKSSIGAILKEYQYDANKSTAKQLSSEVIDDPNLLDVSEYWQGGRYVYEILLRVIQLSIETVQLQNELSEIQTLTNFLGLK